MAILYTQLVSTPERHILCSSSTRQGKAVEANKQLLLFVREILQTIPDSPSDKLFKHDKFEYQIYIRVTSCILSIITDQSTSNEMAEAYFQKILQNLDSVDNEILEEEGNKFNDENGIEDVHNELKSVKKVCVENLNKVVQRGEMVTKFEEYGAKLKEATVGFKRTSRNMYYKEMWDQVWMYGALLFILCIILYFCLWK